MSIVIEEATRQGMIPLIGVYGKTGTGKTRSALLLARGLVGPKGQIGIVETERRRSGGCVGLIPGGFKRINLEEPFTPESYMEAYRAFIEAGIGCVVTDSLSHEWDGSGGVLQMQEAELQRMAGDDYKKREACKMAAWIKPKMRHKLLIDYILRSQIPMVCCLRGKDKTRIIKGEAGEKTQVITDDYSTPIFDKDFIYEMLVNLETVQVDGKPGCAIVTKWTHPDLLKCLPKEGEQITEAHGAALARWCNESGVPTTAPEDSEVKAIKRQLWDLTKSIHGGSTDKLQQWLWDECCLDPSATLAELEAKELTAVLGLARKKLNK